MTYPPSGGTPDPYQPQQPYGQSNDPNAPYTHDPYGAPSSGAPSSGQPGGYGPPPPYQSSGQPYQLPYGQNPYGPPQYGAYGPQRRTNSMAIASLVLSLAGLITCISAPVGVVLGHIAKRQIRQTGEDGDGLATAGLWIGYILTALGVLLFAGWLAIVIFAIGSGTTTT
jgi:Domain of unknown function (DUF4190)